MKRIEIQDGIIRMSDDSVLGFFEKTVNKFGDGAKVDIPKKYLGKKAYVIICKGEE